MSTFSKNRILFLSCLIQLILSNAWALKSTSLPSADQTATLLDIARDENGNVKYMTRFQALDYCSSRGTHLPSALELAQVFSALGAKVVSGCGSDEQCSTIVARKLESDTMEVFSYSYSGYQRPNNDLGSHWFWSSSDSPDLKVTPELSYSWGSYGLSGFGGDFSAYSPQKLSAVGCIR